MARTKNTSRRPQITLDIEPISTIFPDQNNPEITTTQSEPLRITNASSEPINDSEINETEEIVIEAIFELSKSMPNSETESFVTPQEAFIPQTQKQLHQSRPIRKNQKQKFLKPQLLGDLLDWNLEAFPQESQPLTTLSMK
jgi:hypothetical protein